MRDPDSATMPENAPVAEGASAPPTHDAVRASRQTSPSLTLKGTPRKRAPNRPRHPTARVLPTRKELEKAQAKLAEAAEIVEASPGHKRDGGPGRPLAAFDVDFHTAPDVKAPPWTPERTKKFLQTYFDTLCDLRKTCHRLRIPFRAAIARRETDAAFADQMKWVDRMHQERVKGEFRRRVMEDEKHPANIIFELKKTDPQYADAVDKKPVQIAISIGDSALGRPAVIDAVEVKRLEADNG